MYKMKNLFFRFKNKYFILLIFFFFIKNCFFIYFLLHLSSLIEKKTFGTNFLGPNRSFQTLRKSPKADFGLPYQIKRLSLLDL